MCSESGAAESGDRTAILVRDNSSVDKIEQLIIELKDGLERSIGDSKTNMERLERSIGESKMNMERLEHSISDSRMSMERLVINVKESLEREIGGLRHEMHEGFVQVNTRFETQAVRLDRQAGLWQAGARWSTRMDAWADKVDTALEAKDREIADLRERVIKLERKSA